MFPQGWGRGHLPGAEMGAGGVLQCTQVTRNVANTMRIDLHSRYTADAQQMHST